MHSLIITSILYDSHLLAAKLLENHEIYQNFTHLDSVNEDVLNAAIENLATKK